MSDYVPSGDDIDAAIVRIEHEATTTCSLAIFCHVCKMILSIPVSGGSVYATSIGIPIKAAATCPLAIFCHGWVRCATSMLIERILCLALLGACAIPRNVGTLAGAMTVPTRNELIVGILVLKVTGLSGAWFDPLVLSIYKVRRWCLAVATSADTIP